VHREPALNHPQEEALNRRRDEDGPVQTLDLAGHWNKAYARGHSTRSWFQDRPSASLRMLEGAAVTARDSLIDVGGGASTLVDALLDRGWMDVTVVDVSAAGLRTAQERLGVAADRVQWLAADLLTWEPQRQYAVWHDRALLHFFATSEDQDRYRGVLDAATTTGCVAVFGAFASDGPPSCSGLPVTRYGVEDLATFVGEHWLLLASEQEEHHTPAGNIQPFTWASFRRVL
jgi:hypothetical protein